MSAFENDVITRLARIETGVKRLQTDGEDFEKRTRKLERGQWMITGAGSLVAILLAFLGIQIK